MPAVSAPKAHLDGRREPAEVARDVVSQLFAAVDVPIAVVLEGGVQLFVPSTAPTATIFFSSPAVLRLLLSGAAELAAGEAILNGDLWVEGDVEAAFAAMDAIAAVRTTREWMSIVARAAQLPRTDREGTVPVRPPRLHGKLHSPARDRLAIAYHYDVSNEFYSLWLDKNMTYSCAYFQSPTESLDQAQLNKYELICRKLRLQVGERLLDVGCGWGGLVRYAAKQYGVRAIGITLSEKQVEEARRRIAIDGLQERCSVQSLDYREIGPLGSFDKAVSVGMVEHVGAEQLPTYFQAIYDALTPRGVFLNQGIIAQQPQATGVRALAKRLFSQRSRFIESYVFPDGEIPHLAAMVQAAQDTGFELRDVENLREHYVTTLRHWVRRLEDHEEEAQATVGDTTYRVWRYYMAGSANSFRVGRLGVVQMLLAKRSIKGDVGIPRTRSDIYEK